MQGDYFILCTKASCQHFSHPRRNFFHHKSYSFLSRTVRLTNSNPKALLLGCRGHSRKIGVQWGYKYHSHSPKALILSHFRQKYGFCRDNCSLPIFQISFFRSVSIGISVIFIKKQLPERLKITKHIYLKTVRNECSTKTGNLVTLCIL